MTNVSPGIEALPSDALVYIFNLLDYCDLLRCSRVCRAFHEVTMCDQLWKKHCIKNWNANCLTENCNTWRKLFIHWYSENGRYIKFYLKVQKAWHQIETYCKTHCPEIYSSLLDGLNEQQLNELEVKHGINLSNDLRCAYKFHNGQKVTEQTLGLMGSLRVYHSYFSDVLLPLDIAMDNIQKGNSLNNCLPLTYCLSTHQLHYITLSDALGFTPGQIIYPVENHRETHDETNYDTFIMGDCFLNWFCSYAQKLNEDFFPCVEKEIFKFYHDPECIAKTGNITVKAATAFIPAQSTVNPPHFMHAYRITMSMDPSAKKEETCKLQTRHWVITEENGKEQIVDGPGVIGEYPVMKPGANYSYVSCCPLRTTYGHMSGYFQFRNSSTGETINVTCPLFHLRVPPYETSSDRKERYMQLKKSL